MGAAQNTLPDQLSSVFSRWNEPSAPFRIVENIYFVGMRNISSFLLTSPDGHILIDTGFSNSVPLIQSNIVQLGFSPRDIKYILSSHAHCDHAAGHATMKRLTGARVAISKADALLLESGGKTDFLFGDNPVMHFESVSPDLLIEDGQEIHLGKIRLTAHLTPGHTPGCTTWTTEVDENGRRLRVVFFGSTSINPGTKLLTNAAYPGILQDIRSTYDTLRAMPCDVFLAPHPEQFGMDEKLRQKNIYKASNPFIDSTGLKHFLADAEATFQRELAKQLANPSEPTFAPQREVPLKLGEIFDFETEKVSLNPNIVADFRAFLQKSRSGWELVVEGQHNYFDGTGHAWEKMSAIEIARPAGLAAIPSERTGFYPLTAQKLPVTVLIPQWGLLRVKTAASLKSDRPEVLLEYKRIHSR